MSNTTINTIDLNLFHYENLNSHQEDNLKVSTFITILLIIQSITISAFAAQKHSAYNQVVERYVSHRAFNGVVLVAKQGEVVFEKGYGVANVTWDIANNKQTRFKLASLSKPFTALLVMQLVQAGKLSLDDTLDKYLPYLPKEKFSLITIKSLLGHRSGLPRQFVIPGWTDGKFDRLSDKKAYAKEIGKLALISKPGEQYGYTNLGYFLLALVVEKVTQHSFEQALSQYIFKPMGMTNTGPVTNNDIVPKLAQGYQISSNGGYERSPRINMNLFWAGASLYSTARDLFKFEQMLYGSQLLDDKHRQILLAKENRFSWYFEPWTLADNKQPLQTSNWGGELPGVSTFLVRFVDDKSSIIILSNDGLNEVAKRIMARQLASVLYYGDANSDKTPLSLVLTKAMYQNSLHQSIEKAKQNKQQYFIDKGIEQMGMQQMWSGDLFNAVAILSLNVHFFRDSPSAHENLSQALEAKQLWQQALNSKKQALQLLPDNVYLKNEVTRLQAHLSQ